MVTTRLRVLSSAAILAALSHAVLADTPVVTSSTSNLQAALAGQQIQLFIAGTDVIAGENLNVQINNGTAGGPTITAIDILTGTIFGANNTGQTGQGVVTSSTVSGLAFHIATVGTTTNPPTLPATVVDNGLLLTLTLSTVPAAGSTFDINLFGTYNGDSDLVLATAATIPFTFAHTHFSIGSAARQWTVNGGGTWNTDANWTPFAPYAAGDAANFFGALLTNTTASVVIDGPRTVGSINFNNTMGHYSLDPQNATVGTLILNNGLAAPMINDSGGSHTISAPVALTATTNVTVVNPLDTMTLSGNITGAFALNFAGAGKVLLTGSNAYGATSIAAASTVQVGNGTAGSFGTGAVSNSGKIIFGRSDVTAFNNAISGSGSLTMSAGTVSLTGLATYSGSTTVSSGRLVFSGGMADTVAGIAGPGDLQVDAATTLVSDGVKSVGTWQINGAQQIRSNGSAQGTSKVSSLILNGTTNAWTGKLDLTNNLLIVQTTGATGNKATTLSNLVNQVSNGTTGSSGIVSTTLSVTAGTVLAVVDNGAYTTPKTTMRGQTLDANSILVTQALAGDTDLSGTVDFQDLVTLLQSYSAPQNTRVWNNGNFTGNGGNFADLVDLLQDYNHTFGSFSLTPVIDGGIGDAGLTSGTTAPVPEPASLALLALGATGLLARRRRSTPPAPHR